MPLNLPPDFSIDVHTHPIPQFYRDALVDAGYTFDGKELYIDGFITPEWSLESYLENRAKFHYDYSVMSITAPGVSFLKGNFRAKQMARRLNDQLFQWTRSHPSSLGALAILPLPDIEASLEEIKASHDFCRYANHCCQRLTTSSTWQYCLDDLRFEGVGLYTNCNGLYLGDSFYDPIFEELDRRAATVFVHPIAPEPETRLKGVSTPAVEYTFDTTRAIANLLFSGSRKRYPNIKLIFSHGGGTLPFLAQRIAGQSSLPFQGGRDAKDAMEELKGYYFDLAAATSAPQLAALDAFVGPSKLLIGSDVPYFPDAFLPKAQADLEVHAGFSKEEMKKIKHENALAIFPRIVDKLSSRMLGNEK